MNAKYIKSGLAAVLIVAMSMSMFGCGDEKETSSQKNLDSATREQVAEIAVEDERLTGELENNKIIWMANWDINPDETGKNVPIELAIFQERYNGVIEYRKIDWTTRYDSLATAINSDEGVDFFPAGDMDAFPKGAIRGMFVPVDDYIDFDSELWSGVKEANDKFVWNGNHYLIVNAVTGDSNAVIYNRTTIEEAGLTDPAELLEKGEWTWDAFEDMLVSFVDPDEGYYGIDGWWFEAGLSITCGTPYIGLEDGKLVNNLRSENVERVQNWMYELFTKDCVAIGVGDYGWEAKPTNIKEGKTLFYPCGLWALYSTPDQWQAEFGEDVFFVPMPKDPGADAHYIPCGLDAYVMVKGGQNPEGVAKFADCKRVTILNERAAELGLEQMYTDYGWTEEMVEMKAKMDKMALEHPIFDFYTGVTKDVTSILDSNENGIRSASKGTPWSESVAAIYTQIDAMLKEVNDNPVAGGDGDVSMN